MTANRRESANGSPFSLAFSVLPWGFLVMPFAIALIGGCLMALLDYLSSHFNWWADYLETGDE